MIKINTIPLPADLITSENISYKNDFNLKEKIHEENTNCEELPDFYSKLGEIKGLFHTMRSLMGSALVSLEIKKGSYVFDGDISIYSTQAETIVQAFFVRVTQLASILADHPALTSKSELDLKFDFDLKITFDANLRNN